MNWLPRRELIVWENQDLRASLAQALADSAAGNTVDLGDFSQYADDGVADQPTPEGFGLVFSPGAGVATC
jgi:hypothetical protein